MEQSKISPNTVDPKNINSSSSTLMNLDHNSPYSPEIATEGSFVLHLFKPPDITPSSEMQIEPVSNKSQQVTASMPKVVSDDFIDDPLD